MKWLLQAFSRRWDFRGRAQRAEYWHFFAFALLGGFGVSLIESQLLGPTSELLSTVFFAILFVPSLSLTVRRLHDLGYSGWWAAPCLIPIFGLVFLLVALRAGTTGANRYGADPRITG